MGGGIHLEGLSGHVAAQIFGDLAHLEDQLAFTVDPDGGRVVGDRHLWVVLLHELGDGAGLDAVVHGDTALVRDLARGQVDILHRLEDVLLGRIARYARHFFLSFSECYSRPNSPRIWPRRSCETALTSSNETGLECGCDQIG